jgi:hypothetical protein
LAHSFWAFLVLAVVGEFLAAPVGVMADAAVVAACKRVSDQCSNLQAGFVWITPRCCAVICCSCSDEMH